ncbi:hypothetical protein CCYA_CCYA05G1686 [Cyanidiococcus yangmingshanensis]|nr:hypothetical protein CCYA_CCYA05G1686 [Cyanidiococcus yangmingshanensis]
MQKYRREAAHAGSWYTGEATQLERSLAQWLAQVAAKERSLGLSDETGMFRDPKASEKTHGVNIDPQGAQNSDAVQEDTNVETVGANDLLREQAQLGVLIVPHAGYAYSGETAAYAYAQVNPDQVERVVILGPSHHVYMRSCGLSGAQRLATPFGDLFVDTALIQDLIGQHPELFQLLPKKVDEEEHSIEMQLPFLAQVFRTRRERVRFVPVMCGALSPSKEQECGRFFGKLIGQPGTLLVISTDFCHWGRRFRYTRGWGDDAGRERQRKGVALHQYIRALDFAGLRLIAEKNPEAFVNYLHETGNTICGRHPLAVLLWAIHYAEPSRWSVQFLHYAQSSACTDERDSSVSYVAGACWRRTA